MAFTKASDRVVVINSINEISRKFKSYIVTNGAGEQLELEVNKKTLTVINQKSIWNCSRFQLKTFRKIMHFRIKSCSRIR